MTMSMRKSVRKTMVSLPKISLFENGIDTNFIGVLISDGK